MVFAAIPRDNSGMHPRTQVTEYPSIPDIAALLLCPSIAKSSFFGVRGRFVTEIYREQKEYDDRSYTMALYRFVTVLPALNCHCTALHSIATVTRQKACLDYDVWRIISVREGTGFVPPDVNLRASAWPRMV